MNNEKIKIVGITLTYNEEKMIPYVMPYYERMGIDKLVVYDNYSTDNTVALLRHYPFVEVRQFYSDGFNDQVHINIKNEAWKPFKDDYDWCICCDFDEVLFYDGDIRDVLSKKLAEGKTVFSQTMLNLYGYDTPPTDGLVHEHVSKGCLWKDFETDIHWGCKSVLFSLKDVNETNYIFGCHNDNFIGNIKLFAEDICAFHLKYINFDETLRRNTLKTERLSEFNRINHLSIDDQITDESKLRDYYNYMEAHSMSVAEFMEYRSSTYHFYNEDYGIDKYFKKDFDDANKVIVCTCAKNENKYLIEWVNHYLNYGFDKIIICDNNDDNSVESVLEDYIRNGKVEIFDCHGLNSFQVQFYSYFSQIGNYAWCAYFDADEFLEITTYSNIKDYLARKDDDCISFNWMIYGSNGNIHQSDLPVQQRFSQPFFPLGMAKENCFVKSILRGGYHRFINCAFNGSHIPTCSNQEQLKYSIGGYFKPSYVLHEYLPPRYKEGYIKHYCTKSFDEWIKKSRRGWPDGTDNLTVGNYFVTDGGYSVPLEKYYEGFFVYSNPEDTFNYYKDILSAYDVIQMYNTSHCVYTLIVRLATFFNHVTRHAFIISADYIDDATYNMLLELAIKTGNSVIWTKEKLEDNSVIDNIFRKYSRNGGNNYYIMDV